MTKNKSQTMDKNLKTSFDDSFDEFENLNVKLGEKQEQQWESKMDEMIDIIRSDLIKETAPYRDEVGWKEPEHTEYDITFEDFV